MQTLDLQYQDHAPLDYPGVNFTPVGLILPEGLPFARWQGIVETLPKIGDAVKWAIGDALHFGERKYGETYQQALDTGLGEYQTLRNLTYVAARFPLSRRRDNVKWWVYSEVTSLPDNQQEAILDYAAACQPSREELRAKLRPSAEIPPLLFEARTINLPLGVTEKDAHIVLSALASVSIEAGSGRIEKAVKVLAGETTNIHVSDDSYEWYTPAEYLQAARSVMGSIDLDPASSHHAQEMVQAGAFFSRADDGLVQEWRGTVWLNPPYSSPEVDNFMDKLVQEYQSGHVSEAIALTNNSTDTRWFHRAASASSAMCFTKGRIGFWKPEAAPLAARQGQVFFYMGDSPEQFAHLFAPFGLVVLPYPAA